jgi:hypothetical protein
VYEISDGNADILYVKWDIDPRIMSIEVVNLLYDEELDVKLTCENIQIFSLRLRKGRDRGAYTAYGINFKVGDRFWIEYRRMSWERWKSVGVKLIRDSSGSLQAAVTDSL